MSAALDGPAGAPVPASTVTAPDASTGVPVWLLDVDGVVNANKPGWSAAPRQSNAYADGQSHRMRWAPALVDRIRSLHRSGTVEVRWCTTWCPWADQLERMLALPPLVRTLTAEQVVSPRVSLPAKLAVALEVMLVERRPLIWTDDEAVPQGGPNRDLLEAAGMPMLLVAPRMSRGLQRADLDAIEAFAAGLAAGRRSP
jgi:hypothetical protein